MSNVITILRTDGIQTSSFNSESVDEARHDAAATIREGAAQTAEILVLGEVVERLGTSSNG